jgi:Hypervirulence associated proteins TUDOR domain
MPLRKGTSVEWNTPQGPTYGRIVEKKTSDFELDGNTHRASEADPQYVVEAAKTGARAAHKASALTEKD